MKRLWEWLLSLGRWPELPEEERQSIDEQVQARTRYIHDHIKQHPKGPCGYDGCGGH